MTTAKNMSMIQTIPEALKTFPFLIRTDEDLARRFAAPDADIEEICASAYESGDKVLLALSASPKGRRAEGLKSWRKKQVAVIREKVPAVREYLESVDSSIREEFETGERALLELDREATAFNAEEERREIAARREAKASLRQAFHDALQDPVEGSRGFNFPQALYVSAKGEVRLFRRRRNAKAYGSDAGCAHVILRVDSESADFRGMGGS